MSSIIPFNQGQAPAFLQQLGMTPEQVAAMNAGAAVGTGGGGVNRISLKQSRFRLIVGGTETMIIPTLNIQLVVVRTNDGVTKTYYEKEWVPGQDDNTAPDCSSDDGITPRMDSPKRQANTCATCPMNEWGSKINKLTGTKIKACTDGKTMAILPPGSDGRFGNGDLYQLKTPPASLGEFGGFVKGLSSLATPVPYNAVVTDVSFDPQASYPKLLFKPVRYLEPDEYAAVAKRYNEDETKRIAGLSDVQQMRTPQLAAPQQQAQIQQQPVQQQPVQQPVQQQPQAQGYVDPNAGAQAGWGQQPQQAQVQQVQPQVQQPVQNGWGATPVNEPQPTPGANSGWGSPANAQPQQQAQVFVQPQQQVQPQTQPVQGGWGEQPVQHPVATQQPQQQAQQPQQQVQQPQQAPAQQFVQPQNQPQVQQQAPQAGGVVLMANGRPHGKPSDGRKRRTNVEIAEDDAYTNSRNGGQAQPQQTAAPQQQAPAGWGEQPQTQPQQVQQPAQGGWGEQPQQPAPQQQAPAGWGGQPQQAQPQQQEPVNVQQLTQPDPSNPWGQAGQQQAPVGAPNQPGVVAGNTGGMPAFAGWDDAPAQ